MTIEQHSIQPEFDLSRFNARGEAGDLLIRVGEPLPDGVTVPQFIRNNLSLLHPEALWPTYSELLNIASENRTAASSSDYYDHSYGPPQRSQEARALEYAESLLSDSVGAPSDEELLFLEQLGESKRNYMYFADFRLVQTGAARGCEYVELFEGAWKRILSDSLGRDVEQDEPEPQTIAAQWSALRSALVDQHDTQPPHMRAAAALKAGIPSKLYDRSQNPGYGDQATLEGQYRAYNHHLQRFKDEETLAIERVKYLVETVEGNSPTDTANALWEFVLTDDEKSAVTDIKQKFSASWAMVIEASYFNSYTDQLYREFMDEIRGCYGTTHPESWDDHLLAIEETLEPMERILIGDYKRLPIETQKALRDPAKSEPSTDEIADVLTNKRKNRLKGYTADVIIAMLMSAA